MNEKQEKSSVDIEAYAARGEAAPLADEYRVRIDKTNVTVEKPDPTGAELLGLVGKTPDQWLLYEIVQGNQPVPVPPDQKVDLRKPGIERFTTVQRDPTEGYVQARREFDLPASDTSFLDSLGKLWEAIKDGAAMWLLIRDWTVPVGYTVESVTVALQLPPDYPDSQIDMVYFSPNLERKDGRGIGALSDHQLDGKTFQRWSRHRTGSNPWRVGVDDVASHLSLVDDWLRREFSKG